MRNHSVLILAGEASGDYHASALVRDLRKLSPEIRISGIGGDALAESGMTLIRHYREINTIGLSEGISQIRNIFRAYRAMKNELASGKHDIFIPVDYPDVNLRLAGAAKRAGVPVCYYISPQVWAWRKGRIRKIAARVDRMMTIFPFEETLYREAGVAANFVGHTMVGDIPENPDRKSLRDELGLDPEAWAIALVPGSRPAEIERILPRMCLAAQLHGQAYPETQFVLPLAGEHLRGTVESILAPYRLPVTVQPQSAADIMAACDSGLVTSGTATLQAALAGLPHAVIYVLGAVMWNLAMKVIRPLMMDKDLHVAIANVLSIHKEELDDGPLKTMAGVNPLVACLECKRPLLVPELLQHYATPEAMAQWLERLRNDTELRRAMKRGFRQIRAMLKPPPDGTTAAKTVLQILEQ
jgi:lipid-A-disaccharide synthase